jgi:hypothetical protein
VLVICFVCLCPVSCVLDVANVSGMSIFYCTSVFSNVYRYVIACYIVLWFNCFMVLNATFNNISIISRRSVLSVEETAVPRENHDLSDVWIYNITGVRV